MPISKNGKGLFEVDIDGDTFEFSPWSLKRSVKMGVRLARIVADPMTRIYALMQGAKGAQADVAPAVLGGIADKLVERLAEDDEQTWALLVTLCTEGVSRNAQEVDMERDFARKPKVMLQVIKAALEAQYGDFFEGAKPTETTAQATAPSN